MSLRQTSRRWKSAWMTGGRTGVVEEGVEEAEEVDEGHHTSWVQEARWGWEAERVRTAWEEVLAGAQLTWVPCNRCRQAGFRSCRHQMPPSQQLPPRPLEEFLPFPAWTDFCRPVFRRSPAPDLSDLRGHTDPAGHSTRSHLTSMEALECPEEAFPEAEVSPWDFLLEVQSVTFKALIRTVQF